MTDQIISFGAINLCLLYFRKGIYTVKTLVYFPNNLGEYFQYLCNQDINRSEGRLKINYASIKSDWVNK